MNKRKLIVLFAAVLSTAATAAAQSEASKPPSHQFYRLDFALKEMDGSKLVKIRNYQMIASANDRGLSSIRSGARVPTTDNKGGTVYLDIGVNLDVRQLVPTDYGLQFEVVGDASGAMETGGQLPKQPLIYQTKWNAKVEVPMRQATTLFSSDDPSSKHQLQLEVTATPMH